MATIVSSSTGYMKTELTYLLLSVAGTALGDTPAKPATANPVSLPLSFEANRGQTDPAVKFLSRGDGYALFLTRDRLK